MNKKIFIGSKEICFIPKLLKVNSTQENQLNIHVENKVELQLIFDFFMCSKKYSCLNLIGSGDKIFKLFFSIFKVIEASGGVICNGKNEILFIYRLKKWDLPKGKIEKNESKRNAAIRECEEECGISGLKIQKRLSDTFHMYKIGNQWVLKRTYWYKMKSDFTGRLKPQKEEGILKTLWIDKKGMKRVLNNTYPAIKMVMKDVI